MGNNYSSIRSLHKKGYGSFVFIGKKDECAYCGNPLIPEAITLDHVIPLSRLTQQDICHVTHACKHCNNQKKNHLLSEMGIPRRRTLRKILGEWFTIYNRMPSTQEFIEYVKNHPKNGDDVPKGILTIEEFLVRHKR